MKLDTSYHPRNPDPGTSSTASAPQRKNIIKQNIELEVCSDSKYSMSQL